LLKVRGDEAGLGIIRLEMKVVIRS